MSQKSSNPEFDAYMRDVESYLTKVKRGRRVPSVDPTAPRFSQQADDERQARRAGLGSHIKYGPPAPAFEQVHPIPQLQQQQVQPMPQQPAPSRRVWGFHEPTVTAAEGAGAFIKKAGDVLADPRNAWMGLGPMAAVGKGFMTAKSLRTGLMDEGGFRVPIHTTRKDMPDLSFAREGRPAPSDREVRAEYMDRLSNLNRLAFHVSEGEPSAVKVAGELHGEMPQLLKDTMKGQAELEGEVAKRKNSTSGGNVPPPWFKPKSK